jgi:hypothetical protein
MQKHGCYKAMVANMCLHGQVAMVSTVQRVDMWFPTVSYVGLWLNGWSMDSMNMYLW